MTTRSKAQKALTETLAEEATVEGVGNMNDPTCAEVPATGLMVAHGHHKVVSHMARVTVVMGGVRLSPSFQADWNKIDRATTFIKSGPDGLAALVVEG